MRHKKEDGANGEIGDCRRVDGVLEVAGGTHDGPAMFLRRHFIT